MKKFSPQEIAKILRCHAHQGECDPGDCRNGCPYYVEYATALSQRKLYELAAAYIQQLKAQQPRWISVKEREPKRLQRALIYSPVGNRIASGTYTEVGFITQAVIGEITHWMEIPAPPKEDT